MESSKTRTMETLDVSCPVPVGSWTPCIRLCCWVGWPWSLNVACRSILFIPSLLYRLVHFYGVVTYRAGVLNSFIRKRYFVLLVKISTGEKVVSAFCSIMINNLRFIARKQIMVWNCYAAFGLGSLELILSFTSIVYGNWRALVVLWKIHCYARCC